jgi:four helix bundle protein
MKDFRDLEVWKLAHDLTLQTYRATKGFPADERFGLTSQIRRSAASVPANIAEGCGRRGNAEFHRFLQMAMGSASELEYHLLLAKDLEYLDVATHQPLHQAATRVKRMLASLINKVDEARERTRSAGASQ